MSRKITTLADATDARHLADARAIVRERAQIRKAEIAELRRQIKADMDAAWFLREQAMNQINDTLRDMTRDHADRYEIEAIQKQVRLAELTK